MKKYIKHFAFLFIFAFSCLVLVPLVAWLIIQGVFFMGHLCDLYAAFLGNYFIPSVAEVVVVFSCVLFLGSIIFGTIIAWCGLPD